MPDAGRIKILLVDDHAVVAEGLAELLSMEPDLEVVGIAGTAADGVAAARRLEPDVVLMDFRLPDEDGARATARVKAGRPETQVVMLTSEEDDATLTAAIEAGCSGYITKGTPGADLKAAIRRAHAGEALITPALLKRLLPKLARREGPPFDLTPREIEILQLLAEGLSNQAIADKLVLSMRTVRNHVQNVLTKMRVHSRLEAVAAGVRAAVIRAPR